MGLFQKIKEKIGRSSEQSGLKNKGVSTKGILVFDHTSEVIRAETLLKKAGLDVQVKGPPPEVRKGCDLVLEFSLISELQVFQTLATGGIKPLQVLPLQDLLLEPVALFHSKDFGEYLMVRAANMKMTVRKADGLIVNISGGGCPDVPYLAEKLIGKTLADAPEPRELGSTLCGYALQLAYEELMRKCHG